MADSIKSSRALIILLKQENGHKKQNPLVLMFEFSRSGSNRKVFTDEQQAAGCELLNRQFHYNYWFDRGQDNTKNI